MNMLRNAYVWQDGSFPNNRKSILIDNGCIEHIYDEPCQVLTACSEIIDLKGAYVYPGFTDTHTHSFEGGLYSLGADLAHAGSIKAVLELMDDVARKAAKGDFIFAWQFDENSIPEKRFPTIAELDSVCPDKALILRRIDGHSCILNSFARKLVAGLFTTEDEVLRAKFNDLAAHYFHHQLSEDTILKAYHAASRIALQGGFSGLHTMIGDADQSISHYKLIRDNLDKFAVKYTIYPQSFNLKAALDAGASRIGGCILADGSIGSGTAALNAPYQNSASTGNLYQSDAFWMDFISQAHKHNLQVGVHCIGDRAISQINNVYKHLADTDHRDLRHQLIHCELTDDALVMDIKSSGAVPVMQPNFDLLWGGKDALYSRMLGEKRSQNMNRFGSLTRAGLTITGGSDWYITPLDIVQSIQAAMYHHNPDERLTHSQAVDIYTRNAAWLSHEENKYGSIKAGYQADFTVMSSPIDDASQSPKVLKVIRAGVPVYES